jgi:hypothetical protein
MPGTAVSHTYRVGTNYTLVCGIAVLMTFMLHEFSHWLMGVLLDNKMGMTMNNAFPLSGRFVRPSDTMVVGAAGPLFTLLQAILFFFLLYRINNIYFYPFLFAPLYMRVLAGIMNVFNLNDEGRVGSELGIGTYTLSLAVCLVLYGMVFIISKKNRYPLKFNLVNLLLVLLLSSVLILADQFLKIRII